jgi:hypothetical protein
MSKDGSDDLAKELAKQLPIKELYADAASTRACEIPMAIRGSSSSRSLSGLGPHTGARAYVALGQFSIQVPDGAASPMLAPARQPPKHGV